MVISSAGDHRAIVMDKNVYMVWRYIQDGLPEGSIYIEAYNPCAVYKRMPSCYLPAICHFSPGSQGPTSPKVNAHVIFTGYPIPSNLLYIYTPSGPQNNVNLVSREVKES
jgi:hypothetical protein